MKNVRNGFPQLWSKNFENSIERYKVHLDTRRRANVVGSKNACLLLLLRFDVAEAISCFPPQDKLSWPDEESSEALLNATTPPDARTIFVEFLGEVKKMNGNFTNISYVNEEHEAVNDIHGVETAFLDAQVAQLTTKQPDSDLLAARAKDLDRFRYH